jgi:hypothetical protein
VGWLTAGTVVGFGVVALATTQAQSVPDGEDVLAARYLAAAAAPADRIVSTGMRRAIVVYYLDRAGRHAELSSFPPEIDGHPGWYSADRLLRDRDRLAGEGERLASDLATAAAGRSLWILSSPPNDVDRYFFRPLLRHFTIDEARSRRQWGVICLTHQ